MIRRAMRKHEVCGDGVAMDRPVGFSGFESPSLSSGKGVQA